MQHPAISSIFPEHAIRRRLKHRDLPCAARLVHFRMTEMQWHSVEQKPWPFVAVTVRLPDDTETLAVWTGHIWWGTGRELTVAAWQPAQALRQSAA